MESRARGGDQADQIQQTSALLLNDFIYDRIQRDGDNRSVLSREQLGIERVCDPHLKDISMCLRKIGDDLDGNIDFRRLVNESNIIPNKETFMKVALEIFSDGRFNWGRVVTLFYFTFRLVVKAITSNVPDIIKQIIGWTLDYLTNYVLDWIREQGGWEGVRAYFGTPTWQMAMVFGAGVLTALVVVHTFKAT
ncbi:apoptosis regulator BAX-like isoform 1-T1 [Synchiropus picturatus]